MQPCLYLAGVGTDRYRSAMIDDLRRRAMLGGDYALFQSTWAGRSLGALAGYGIGGRIKEAYAFIVDNFIMGQDQLFLFGFSRGAYAARSLAGFINEVGLLLKDRLDLVPKAYELYRTAKGREFLQKGLSILLSRSVVLGDAPVPVYMIGVWDTVGALGLPPPFQAIRYRTDHHLVHSLPSNVMYGRHALALHELRSQFEPILWDSPCDFQSIEQVWFAGAHADVGGGYTSSTVSTIPLLWIAEQAKALGLDISGCKVEKQDVRAEIHHQIRGVFSACTPVRREALAQLADPSFDGDVATHYIHSSALRRRDWMEAADRQYPFRRAIREQLKEVDRLTRQVAIRTTRFRDSKDLKSRVDEYGDQLTSLKQFLETVDPEDAQQITTLVELIVLAKLAHGLEDLLQLSNIIEDLQVNASLANAPVPEMAGGVPDSSARRTRSILEALRKVAEQMQGSTLGEYIGSIELALMLQETLPAKQVRIRKNKL